MRAADIRQAREYPLTESLALNFLTRLLWAYTEKLHPELSNIPEPIFGNPPAIMSGGRLISQDLANSVLKYASFAPAVSGTVCELGGGYGRNAYVTTKLGKFDRYIMSDISPALAVAQEFITKTFPGDEIFTFRPFSDFNEVADEFRRCRFAFFLPHQLSLLPDGSVDLFLNISSLHEMEQRQVTITWLKSTDWLRLRATSISKPGRHRTIPMLPSRSMRPTMT